jgi:hypothetical protein
MVKALGLIFAGLLVIAHFVDAQGDAYHRPLSMFRDYDPVWIGYTLFALLVAMGLLTARTAYRAEEAQHTIAYLVSTALLTVVATTTSNADLHLTCALVAMIGLFVYYGLLLYYSDHLAGLLLHLLMPSFLMLASRIESYGIWQKGMILYFVAATVIHHDSLLKWLPKRRSPMRKSVSLRVGRKPFRAMRIGDSTTV